MSDSSIVVRCKSCGVKIRFPAESAKIRCPKCKAEYTLRPKDDVPLIPVSTQTKSPVNLILQRTVLAGFLTGLILAAGIIFFFRPMLGIFRVGLYLGFLLSIPLFQIVYHLLTAPLPTADTASAVETTTPSRLRRMLTFEFTALIFPILAIVAEGLAPSQGVLAGIMTALRAPDPVFNLKLPSPFPVTLENVPAETPRTTGRTEEQADRLREALAKHAEESRKPREPQASRRDNHHSNIEGELWAQADFLLVNPTHYAVGIRDTGLTGKQDFEILVKAEDKAATEAQKIAWEHKTPVIGIDRGLTRTVFFKHAQNEKLDDELKSQVGQLFERRTLIPRDANLIAYFDTVNNLKRVGFIKDNSDDSFGFVDLVPRRSLESRNEFEVEQIVRSERVQPASEQQNLNDLSLRTSVDFLDYCIYQILRTIQFAPKQDYQIGDPFVFVADVVADTAQYQTRLQPLKDERGEALRELHSDTTPMRTETILGLFTRVVVDREEELARRSYRDDRRKELQEEIASLKEQMNRLKVLLDAEKRLTSEIRSRLVRAGIKQVERSDRAQELISTKVSGKNWIKPGSEEAVTSNLVQATHLLLTDIRQPEVSGRYQLSMRIVDVLTGEILWEDQGDRVSTGSPTYDPGELSSAAGTSGNKWNGVWVSPNGDRAEIKQEGEDAVRISILTGNREVAYSLLARVSGDSLKADRATVRMTRSTRIPEKSVDAGIRRVDDRTLDIGCNAVTSSNRSISVGNFRWGTFRKEDPEK